MRQARGLKESIEFYFFVFQEPLRERKEMNKKHWSLYFASVTLTCVALIASCAIGTAVAQESQSADNSGTNPTTLNRAFVIGNDFRQLPGNNGRWFNNSYVRYAQPFNNGSMNLVIEAPFASTNVLGGTRGGFSDASLKWNWVAHVDRTMGVVPSFKVTAPTASEDVFGSGRWIGAPGLTVAFFLTPEWIIAPAVVHSFSFGDPNGRGRINRTDFDLYAVYKPKGQNWWLTGDLTVGYDFIARTWPATFKLALGTNIGKLGDGAVNLSIRPGIGIGRDRPANYSIEVSLSVVGF
jgi:hypothetical protein